MFSIINKIETINLLITKNGNERHGIVDYIDEYT